MNMQRVHGVRQMGFGLISALFLLVVIAALAGFAVTLSTTQSQGQALDIVKARAREAALAGIEWAAYNVSIQDANSKWEGCARGSVVELGDSMPPFSRVTVDCAASSYRVGDAARWVYEIEAIARTEGAAGDPNYVEQTIATRLLR